MSKTKNKFIALLVVFTSIISFLPVGFGGQVAKAAGDVPTEATAVRVKIEGQKSELPSRIDTTNNDEKIYSTTATINPPDGFDITVKDVTKTLEQLKLQAKGSGTSQNTITGVVDQRVDISGINGILLKHDDATDTDVGKDANAVNTLADIGIDVQKLAGLDPSGENVLGKRIVGLPLGVNKVKYNVVVWTQSVTYIPEVRSADKTTVITPESYTVEDKVQLVNTSDSELTIEHGTSFVTAAINKLLFKSYVGSKTDFSKDPVTNEDVVNTIDNNAKPFLYYQEATQDKNMPLRYNFDIPDSTDALKYEMTFDKDLSSASVYKDGTLDPTVSINGNTLEGTLERVGTSGLIVIKINADTGSGTLFKTYSLEVRYNPLSSDKDFSIVNAGITKLDYSDDNGVIAYIGKKFIVDSNAGYPTYTGDITIDPRARMISIDPLLKRDKSTVAYVVTNNYSNGSSVLSKSSELKNGKQFIDFQAGSISNEINIYVYQGSNGSITDQSKVLVRYILKVNLGTSTNTFTTNLAFSGAGSPYLTQPGVKTPPISFKPSRRTYDLYYGDKPINIELTTTRTDKHEYIKVFYAEGVDSNNLKEFDESKANVNGDDPSLASYRNTSINVTVDKSIAKKIVVQTYYDKYEEQTIDGVTKNVLVGSYPVEDSYIFYLPENFDDSNNPQPGDKSSNALLDSLSIKGYTLTSSDGTSGFSSDKTDYSTTVAKEDTTAKITVTPQEDTVKSMVATIDGSETSYDLASGEVSELPLNAGGTTVIKIVVTAEDGTTTKTYTVVVKNNSKGSDANLKNVILNVGDYNFNPQEDTTKVRVDQNVTSIKVTPIPEDSKATSSVNGEDYLSSPVTVSLKGAQKTEIEIEVTSEDGTETKTYTLEIYRVDPADWNDDSGNNGNSDDGDDQFYDEYNDCWVDLTKYDEWGSVNGKPVYFDKKNRQVKNAWITTGGKNYYLNNLGYRASGWKIDDKTGQTYYLDPSTGEMRKGWMNLNNRWYYLQLNGLMKTGWLYANGKWYYFAPNGQMVVNQSMYIDGKIYNFGQDGGIY